MTRDELLPQEWTALQRAAYATVHDYVRGHRRGAAALAPLVGKTPATLSNEVNPGMDHHKLGLEDSVVIQHATDDTRMIEAAAMELGGVFVRLPPVEFVPDVELLTQCTAWMKAIGETNAAIHDALEDGALQAHELDLIRRRFNAHIAKGQLFLHRLAQIAEPGND